MGQKYLNNMSKLSEQTLKELQESNERVHQIRDDLVSIDTQDFQMQNVSGGMEVDIHRNNSSEFQLFKQHVNRAILERTSSEQTDFRNSIPPGLIPMTDREYDIAQRIYLENMDRLRDKRFEIWGMLNRLEISDRQIISIWERERLKTGLNILNAWVSGPQALESVPSDLAGSIRQYRGEREHYNILLLDITEALIEFHLLNSTADNHYLVYYGEFKRRLKYDLIKV